MTQWSIAPVIDWLMHKGRHLATREEVVSGICERLRAAGLPIDRVAFFFFTLHPQYAGVALYWDGHKVTLNRGEHGFRSTQQYLTSPAVQRQLMGAGIGLPANPAAADALTVPAAKDAAAANAGASSIATYFDIALPTTPGQNLDNAVAKFFANPDATGAGIISSVAGPA